MAAEQQAINITKCTRCHMRHKDDMFGTNRLGEKFKTCNTCREKTRVKDKKYRDNNADKVKGQKKAYVEANKDKIAVCKKAYNEANKDKIAVQRKAHKDDNKCQHGVYNKTCYTCASGPMFCEHKVPRTRCITCTPKNFCTHRKRLGTKCRYCNPELFCNHDGGKQIAYCNICQAESKMNNPEIHCVVEGHYGLLNKCCQCKCVEMNKERLRLKLAAEEAN